MTFLFVAGVLFDTVGSVLEDGGHYLVLLGPSHAISEYSGSPGCTPTRREVGVMKFDF